jgi:hypothetical protein
MCLKTDDKRTKRVLRTLKDRGGKATMWKVLIVRPIPDHKGKKYIVETPFMKTRYFPGWNKSNRKGTKLTKQESLVYRPYSSNPFQDIELGIHVLTNLKRVKEFKHDFEVAVPVTVQLKDFVAAGQNYDAAFTKVFLAKKDYDQAIEDYKKYLASFEK